MTEGALLAALANMKGAKFASFTYRSVESGELARHTIMLGVDLRNVYVKDRAALQAMLPELDGLKREAAEAVLKSIEESLAKGLGNNSAYTHGPMKGDTYRHVEGIPGLSISTNDGSLHVKGLSVNKVVLEEGTWPVVNSRPLTIAKKEIKAGLRQSKIRQFALRNLKAARLNGETLEFDTDYPPASTPAGA